MKARLTARGVLAARILRLEHYEDMELLLARVAALEERYGSAEKALEAGEPKVVN